MRAACSRRNGESYPRDDPHYVVGELEFDTTAEAHACADALHELWKSRLAAPALLGAPQLRIVEAVEDRAY